MVRRITILWLIVLIVGLESGACRAQQPGDLPPGVPLPQEGDYIPHDFRFRSGEVLAELRLYYLTFGQPVGDANGRVSNAVGTGPVARDASFSHRSLPACCLGRGNCWM